jgi:hypothetical protein
MVELCENFAADNSLGTDEQSLFVYRFGWLVSSKIKPSAVVVSDFSNLFVQVVQATQSLDNRE